MAETFDFPDLGLLLDTLVVFLKKHTHNWSILEYHCIWFINFVEDYWILMIAVFWHAEFLLYFHWNSRKIRNNLIPKKVQLFFLKLHKQIYRSSKIHLQESDLANNIASRVVKNYEKASKQHFANTSKHIERRTFSNTHRMPHAIKHLFPSQQLT